MPDNNTSLSELETSGDFIRRHIGSDRFQIAAMLETLGFESLEDVLDNVIPDAIVSRDAFAMRETMSEREAIANLRRMGERNQVFVSMIGMGYYDTIMPEVIKRNVLENPGWYTAYTPYQAEISQGRLEALLNFQQLVTDLCAMEIANASVLDEATAAAEAMAMARRTSKSDSNVFIVDQQCHPQTIAVVTTRAQSFGFELVIGDPTTTIEQTAAFGVLLQYPGTSGVVADIESQISAAHARGAIVAVASDLLALCLLKPPGEMGADIVLGSAQRFGVPMGYGGPHAGFFATREKFVRLMPGRLIGVSVDVDGRRALRMALQTREQHIRRERATSNICTSQVLLAVIAGFYAIYHGPRGLRQIAARVHRLAQVCATGVAQLGYDIGNEAFFDTLTINVPNRALWICAKAREQHINLRVVDVDTIALAFDETTTREQVTVLWQIFARGQTTLDIDNIDALVAPSIPDRLYRTSDFLTHPTFENYHSETEMMRYMRKLARRDIALDRAMIPLGSCTMKLNAATELQPLSYPGFNALHPFVPLEQAQGYRELIEELEEMLCDLTGFTAYSMQPNAGSQGEYAGLLTIRKFHESNGNDQRNVCLIPASAHGTNPASAVMAGMAVVVVKCDDNGNIDIADLELLAQKHRAQLAALMVTYPSTHGVFEESIKTVCEIIHRNGGQVYMDGANLNALVGIGRPAEYGVDVMHVNLHKTFAIPHGGGGPGMGPIGVAEHLMRFLPQHPVVPGVNPAADVQGTIGTVSAAPWGSASILTISWAYISMMGFQGLRRATLVAILAANYIAKRLSPYFPILYTGKNGMVAHECIIDLRPIKASSGITVDDVAKRLIDYGFHAPTMSFPVPDTLMIEPTESENKREIDRFCTAMIKIRGEITAIEVGDADRQNNALKNAPHTQQLLLSEPWAKPYSREQACFPEARLHEDKYWAPVGRIDNAHGDKNLMCDCPPIAAYGE